MRLLRFVAEGLGIGVVHLVGLSAAFAVAGLGFLVLFALGWAVLKLIAPMKIVVQHTETP